MIKDEKELATIRRACSISDRAFTDVLDFIKPGQTTELQVANFLDFRMREYGASGVSFESIIAQVTVLLCLMGLLQKRLSNLVKP